MHVKLLCKRCFRMYKIYLHIIRIIPSNGGGIFAVVSFGVVVLVFVVAGRTQPKDG